MGFQNYFVTTERMRLSFGLVRFGYSNGFDGLDGSPVARRRYRYLH